MPDLSPVLLLTRPAAQSERFAALARARFGAGLPIVVCPLMAAEFLSPQLPLDGLAGLVFTSETGVAGFARLTDRRDLPAHCVGAATARAARAAGLAVATTGEGDGAALARRLAGAQGPLLWPRGAEAAQDLAGLFARGGTDLHSAVVYRQAPLPADPAARTLLASRRPVLLPLFSPRSAGLLARALPDRRAPILLAAMSPAVAEAAAALAPARTVIARAPDPNAMLDALADLIAAPPAA